MFKPGQSGNPHGRPKKAEALTEILRLELDKCDVEYGEDEVISGKEAIARRLKEMAVRGDPVAIKYIYDRLDGRPRESLDIDQAGEIVYKIIPAVVPNTNDAPD